MRCDRKPSLPGTGDKKPTSGTAPLRSLDEVARLLGMSSHQVKYLEGKILAKLREGLERFNYQNERM